MNDLSPRSDELAGMTVNERLFACGRLAAFDDAVGRGDAASARALLRGVDTPPSDIERIVVERIGTRAAA